MFFLLLRIFSGIASAESNWEIISQDPKPFTREFIQDVWCIAENDVYVLTLVAIYHYDGTQWTLSYDKGGRRLWASGPTDVYAVGENSNTYFHFDGAQWTWRSIVGQGGDVNAVWGTAADDVFIVGDNGGIFHYDGTRWQVMTSPVEVDLKDVWGSSGQDMYTVGTGNILHFDGAQWTSMPIGPSSDAYTDFCRVWGASSDEIFLLGGSTIYKLSDGQWVPAKTSTYRYQDLWGSSPSDIYALDTMAHIAHFNGSEWQAVDTGMDVDLNAIHGTASNHIIAVGEFGHIQRYDGQEWQVMSSGAGLSDLRAIWGSGESDVYIVGASGRIMHYDGDQWIDVLTNTQNDLNSVWGSGADNLYVAGDEATLLHFDGDGWQQVSLPTESFQQMPALMDIWGSGETDVFVAGALGTVFHFDGAQWTLMDVPDAYASHIFGSVYQDFHSIWGTASDCVFTTGMDYHDMGHGSSMTFRPQYYNGSQWQNWNVYFDDIAFLPESPADLGSPAKIWGTSPTDIYFYGTYDVYHFDGENWTEMDDRVVSGLEAIWGPSRDDLFMVGGYGAIAHFDGLAWKTMEPPTDSHLYAVWGSSSDDVYAVGQESTILHYTGDSAEPSLDGGYLLTGRLWAKAVFQTPIGNLDLIWRLLGTDLTPDGAQVLSGYFYADPDEFPYGSPSNPEIFVKIYVATNGWCNIAFNHATVDDVMVYSALDYNGTPDQTGHVTLSQRLAEHQYDDVPIDTTVQSEVVDAVAGSADGYQLTNELWARAALQPATGTVALAWREVGCDLTPSGDRVVSGYFYAHPDDFASGSIYNPEIFVKVYIATNGWANIAFNHVTVDDVDIASAHNYSGVEDQTGTATRDNRVVEHAYEND